MDANAVWRKWNLYLMGTTNEQKKMMGIEIDESKTMIWENEEEACAWMKQLVPGLEDWATAIIWQILDDAKSDPEGMDIDKLHASAHTCPSLLRLPMIIWWPLGEWDKICPRW